MLYKAYHCCQGLEFEAADHSNKAEQILRNISVLNRSSFTLVLHIVFARVKKLTLALIQRISMIVSRSGFTVIFVEIFHKLALDATSQSSVFLRTASII